MCSRTNLLASAGQGHGANKISMDHSMMFC
jgi:hypothetical protein